jgi:peptidoglycan/LPS O-acetylase OafA/YrhL
MAVGAFMIAKGMLLVFAGDPQAAYETGGTLKPTHAVTMHAILVLPALAWLLSFANWNEGRRLRVVLLAAAGYIVIAGLVAVWNLSGLELSQTPLVVALFALGALALLAAGLLALSGVARTPSAGRIQHGG